MRQSQVREDPRFLRTEENYSSDLKTLARGIREKCVLKKIPSFHVTRNIAFDPDHDILEGVLRYETTEFLSNFIKEIKFFCVQTGGKSRIACLCVERHAVNCASASKSGEMFIPPASKGDNVHTTRFNGQNVHTARNLTARG